EAVPVPAVPSFRPRKIQRATLACARAPSRLYLHLMKLIRLFALSLGLLVTSATFAEQFSVLLFSKTDGWHHDSINAGVTAVQELGKLHDFNVFWTEDANRVFNDKELPKYKAVIFLLTTGDVLNAEQQAAFERYMR